MNKRYVKGLLLFVSGLMLSISLLALLISKDNHLSERHTPFSFTESFDYNSESFQDYIDYSQRLLRAAQVETPTEQLVKNASPFVLEPGPNCPSLSNGKYPKGIVLSHGLVASPYSMKDIADYFQSRCFKVLAILMPGHATRPGDFLNVSWQELAESQRFATRLLARDAESIYIAGHSVGATLALLEATLNSEIDGLVLFAPAMEVAAASKYAHWLALLGKLFLKAAWFEVLDDSAIYRYESFSFSAAAETYSLIKATQAALAKSPLSIPVFTVTSSQDNTVKSSATLDFMGRQENPLSKTLLYSQYSRKAEENIILVNSSMPQQNILSLSHLGLMVSPKHVFYGDEGIYRSCKHYVKKDLKKLQSCQTGKKDFYGEVTKRNLTEGVIERIAFNPFYDDMLEEIDVFLASISP